MLDQSLIANFKAPIINDVLNPLLDVYEELNKALSRNRDDYDCFPIKYSDFLDKQYDDICDFLEVAGKFLNLLNQKGYVNERLTDKLAHINR